MCHGDVEERETETEKWRKEESVMGMLRRERDRGVEEGRKCHGDVEERERDRGVEEGRKCHGDVGGERERDRGVEEGRKCHGDVGGERDKAM